MALQIFYFKEAMKLFALFGVFLITEVTCETAVEYRDLILQKHNDYRRQQGGSNINKLVWSDTLAQEADAWISKCNFEHQNAGHGENLAMNTAPDETSNIEEAFSRWYAEINHYNYAGKSCGASCHYTQLVWYNTREVGCATTRCPSLNMRGRAVKNAWFFGCWYDPAGNDRSEYPFLRGAPCSQCLEGQTCEDELCAGKGKEKCEDKNADCPMWEASGSCENNKMYMEKNCRMSCGFCEGGQKGPCEDKNANCAVFKPTCETNKSWMKPNCAKTCGFC